LYSKDEDIRSASTILLVETQFFVIHNKKTPEE